MFVCCELCDHCLCDTRTLCQPRSGVRGKQLLLLLAWPDAAHHTTMATWQGSTSDQCLRLKHFVDNLIFCWQLYFSVGKTQNQFSIWTCTFSFVQWITSYNWDNDLKTDVYKHCNKCQMPLCLEILTKWVSSTKNNKCLIWHKTPFPFENYWGGMFNFNIFTVKLFQCPKSMVDTWCIVTLLVYLFVEWIKIFLCK